MIIGNSNLKETINLEMKYSFLSLQTDSYYNHKDDSYITFELHISH